MNLCREEVNIIYVIVVTNLKQVFTQTKKTKKPANELSMHSMSLQKLKKFPFKMKSSDFLILTAPLITIKKGSFHHCML